MTCNRPRSSVWRQLEEGDEIVDSHFDQCPDCREIRAQHRVFTEKLRDLGAGWQTPPDFEAQVWGLVARHKRQVWWNRLVRWAPVGAVGAAATVSTVAVVLYFINRSESSHAAPPIDASISGKRARESQQEWKSFPPFHWRDEGSQTKLAGGPAVDSWLSFKANLDGARYGELLLYRGKNERVHRCGTHQQRCQGHSDGDIQTDPGFLTTRYRFDTMGTYRMMLIVSDAPIPEVPPTVRTTGEVMDYMIDAGARCELSPQIIVR